MKNPIGKRLQIKDANSRMVLIVAVSAVLLVFALVSAKVLIGEITYTTRVLRAKDKAASQLEQNVKTSQDLIAQYKIFSESSVNVLGGSATGAGPLDGPNDRIVLDSLPSKYDFPGLVSSLEKIIKSKGAQIQSITGTDNEVENSDKTSSPNPEPVAMSFSFDANGNYQQLREVINDFQRSIRPFNITKMTLTGSNTNMVLNVQAETYFQPTKSVEIEKKEIK